MSSAITKMMFGVAAAAMDGPARTANTAKSGRSNFIGCLCKSLFRAMRIKAFLVMTHDIVAFHVVAARGGVRHIRDGKELVGDAEFLEIGGVFKIEVVVEAFGAVPD